MTLASVLSSFLPSAACEEVKETEVEKPEESEDAEKEEAVEEEEEEEEPEDQMVGLREECKESGACVKFTKHFEHCQEKVEAGEGFKGEDCVEEMFHMMHCVDNCVAPKLFAKLR